MNKVKALAAVAAMTVPGAAFAQTAGVTDDEIKIGGAHDLSGIFAPFSVPAVTAANLVFEEVNANGGIHGRKITYIVEDHGYQVPKAAQAANKLINRDEVFAMLLNLGTPHNLAMFQLMEPKGIPNVSPITAARQMIEPPAPWKFAGTSSYYDAIKATAEYMVAEEGASKFCLMILPTDFGKEIEAAVHEMAEAGTIEMGAEIAHKPDESDFTGALGKVKESGCDTVGMALGVSQQINAITTANKLGMDVRFMLSGAGFHTVVAKGLAAQGVMGGVYAGAGWQDLEARAGQPEVQEWIASYKEATGEDFPSTGALLGYGGATTMVKALEAAGPDLTHESFIAAMESLDYEDPIGGNRVDYSADDHVGADEVFVSRIENGSWVLVQTLE
ncbi:ABC transporter substrate-binding protein [Maritimibacter alkaliphilus]|uniref:Branched-chain amino acid ABC transporter, periplasmic substrate-binding protein n=1 Tax=Maritimibacter alkaliphilus HTCC2654 TaxID=314271 RepID=A3VJW6_9RHOB|nr:ABC transporter substrate-binding protein [Maritimibacter alkaliphilus]EAQ11472.1 branched-chain amino acid ABC transporter, periplasmic substrate-binding protein [Rhodobacterales bacterium HTCC2654] [Maritimibacter alkaliphilus HTCC2654]TYP83265.1 amino acid/amide ABC transporter substrate-binding protein (HAAT family) [Maritimibacter alkaliphilus HTCC2654]